MLCLLDKVTARRILEGLLKLAGQRELSDEEVFALDLYQRAQARAVSLFIVPPTARFLQRLEESPRYGPLIRLFRDRVEVALPARYFSRWSRRLRDFDFSREDAAVLALGTFGTNETGAILGMDYVVTFDQPMINNWATRREAIEKRLETMRPDLPSPYHRATLPEVLRPEHLVLV